MPLTTIVNIRKKSSKIDLWCKDLFIAKFRFPPNTKCLSTFNDALLKAQPMTIDRLFAFCVPRGADQEHYWDLYSVMSEMKVHARTRTHTEAHTYTHSYIHSQPSIIADASQRLKVNTDKWRVSYANSDFMVRMHCTRPYWLRTNTASSSSRRCLRARSSYPRVSAIRRSS